MLLNLLGTVIAATAASMISFSLWITWKRTGYKLLEALMVFFAVLSFNQGVSTITNLAYLLNAHTIYVLPLFEMRQIIFTSAIVYVLYRLWRRNNKVRKLMEVVTSVEETLQKHT